MQNPPRFRQIDYQSPAERPSQQTQTNKFQPITNRPTATRRQQPQTLSILDLVKESEPLPRERKSYAIRNGPLYPRVGAGSQNEYPIGTRTGAIRPSGPGSSSFAPKPKIPTLTQQQQMLREAEEWWNYDSRAAQIRQIMLLPSPASMLTQTPRERQTRNTTTALFAPLIVNLQAYLTGQSAYNTGEFGFWAVVPEWCIDTSGGTSSFFGEDWGAPPPRVGRDPRFRPINGFGSPYEDRLTLQGRPRGHWYT